MCKNSDAQHVHRSSQRISPGPTTFRAAGDNPVTTSQPASPSIAKPGASRNARRHARFAPNQTPPIERTAPPLPASGSWQPIRTRLPSGTPHPSGTSLADGFTVRVQWSLLSQRDLPTCSDSPGSTHAVAPHRARLETTPRQFDHLCNWAPSTMPRLPPTPRPPPRPTTRCAAHCVANAVPTSCRSVPTIAIASPEGWYSDYGGSPPPTRRTRTKSYTPGSTKCTFSTSLRSTVDGFRLPQYGLKERSCVRRW